MPSQDPIATDPVWIGKTYIDPKSAEVIIEMIAELKKKTAIAEEQLELLVLRNNTQRQSL